MIDAIVQVFVVWLMWEFMTLFISYPARNGEPIRPPLSVQEYYFQYRR